MPESSKQPLVMLPAPLLLLAVLVALASPLGAAAISPDTSAGPPSRRLSAVDSRRCAPTLDRLGGLWSKFDVVGDSLAAAVARATDLGTLDLIDDKLLAVRGMYGDSFFGNLGVQGLGAWRGIHGLASGAGRAIAEHPERLALPFLWAPDVVGGIGQGTYQAGQGIGGVVGGAMSNDRAAIDRGLLQYGEIAGPFLVMSGAGEFLGGRAGAPPKSSAGPIDLRAGRRGSIRIDLDNLFRKEPVKPYEVGVANNLKIRSIGDNLDVHHVPQAHAAQQVIPGYDGSTAPAIAIPRQMHRAIPKRTGPFTKTPRTLLGQDVRSLKRHTKAPNSALQQMIELNKTKYPKAYERGCK